MNNEDYALYEALGGTEGLDEYAAWLAEEAYWSFWENTDIAGEW